MRKLCLKSIGTEKGQTKERVGWEKERDTGRLRNYKKMGCENVRENKRDRKERYGARKRDGEFWENERRQRDKWERWNERGEKGRERRERDVLRECEMMSQLNGASNWRRPLIFCHVINVIMSKLIIINPCSRTWLNLKKWTSREKKSKCCNFPNRSF